MQEDFHYKEVQTELPAERALDVAATVANLIPLIGGPVASILSSISGGRKEQRILEVIQGVSEDLRDFQSTAAEEYVKTEDFEELLENTLRIAAQERIEQKRRLFRNIVTRAIKHPGSDYEEQLRFVKTLEDLSLGHLVILLALTMQPEPGLGIVGSPMQTLTQRVPDCAEAEIEHLVNELNDRGITSLNSLRVMMTAHGAADLRHAVTPYGQRFLAYIEAT